MFNILLVWNKLYVGCDFVRMKLVACYNMQISRHMHLVLFIALSLAAKVDLGAIIIGVSPTP